MKPIVSFRGDWIIFNKQAMREVGCLYDVSWYNNVFTVVKMSKKSSKSKELLLLTIDSLFIVTRVLFAVTTSGEWIQVDLRTPAAVTGVVTQGRSDYDGWVT